MPQSESLLRIPGADEPACLMECLPSKNTALTDNAVGARRPAGCHAGAGAALVVYLRLRAGGAYQPAGRSGGALETPLSGAKDRGLRGSDAMLGSGRYCFRARNTLSSPQEFKKRPTMKATLQSHVIAESDDIVETGGYAYFPPHSVHLEWLEKAPKTARDLECPHGVQFYDVLVDGVRAPRAAWCYEAPLPRMEAVGGRFGFWEDVAVSRAAG